MSVTLAYPKVKILEEPEKFLLIIFSAKQALVKEDQVNKLFSRKKVIDAYESHFFQPEFISVTKNSVSVIRVPIGESTPGS